ncbi:hypothetical protein VTI74DRAFT_811 [Chaetomium olivicolor]
MSGSSEMDLLHEQTSLRTSRSRHSIVATIRRKASRLFGRDVTNTVDKHSQPIEVHPPPPKRNWFSSVGARFSRRNHRALDSQESSSSNDVRAECWEMTGTIAPPSSPELSPTRSSTRRRMFGSSRFRLHSLPAKFRRGAAGVFRPSSSTSLSDDFGNIPAVSVPAPRLTPTGSWSSFRIGVQKAVREAVNGNFRFADDHEGRSQPAKPPTTAARAPVRTLWTIMSADSSEGHSSPNKSTQGIPPASLKSTWSPDLSPVSPSTSSNNIAAPSASDNDETTPTPTGTRTASRACSVASTNSTTVVKPTSDKQSCCSQTPSGNVALEQHIQMPEKSPASEKAVALPVVVLQEVGNKSKLEAQSKAAEIKMIEIDGMDVLKKEDAQPVAMKGGKEVV